MTVKSDDVVAITENVLKTMLDFDVATTDFVAEPDSAEQISSFVQISGAWEGTVIVESSLGLARDIAGGMFGISTNSVSEDDLQDALAEITNMVGGNIKGLVNSPSFLSIPCIAKESTLAGPGQPKVVFQQSFVCRDELLRITLCQQD
ncbi:chemotaxis protein CheX [Anatilimnocola sp. NA78]|uniref:chemotaxis protein CheX n=1 Tax=Anatilimnocola sp. NA78 TaxID=3415683 RepID=UPI003CE5A792